MIQLTEVYIININDHDSTTSIDSKYIGCFVPDHVTSQ